MACEYGWRAAPPTLDGIATTNFSHKCFRAAGHADSLHSCLDLCGPGASPVCPGSELETEFIYTFMSEAGYSQNWLGWYRNPGGGVSCVSSNAGTVSPADLHYLAGEQEGWRTGRLANGKAGTQRRSPGISA